MKLVEDLRLITEQAKQSNLSNEDHKNIEYNAVVNRARMAAKSGSDFILIDTCNFHYLPIMELRQMLEAEGLIVMYLTDRTLSISW